MKHPTIVFCDNTSADNPAMVDAATRPSSSLDVKLVVVSGRAAHGDPNASVNERDDVLSAHYHTLNTKRMTGYVKRMGRSIPVYQGESVYRTQLRTTVPHAIHANEHEYDLLDDWTNTPITGSFTDALAKLREIIAGLEPQQKLMVLVGGPCTELAIILRYCPDIAARLGTIVIQAGDFAEDESSNLKGGKGNSFNGAVDSAALHDVLFYHLGDVYILPSNMTKQHELGLTVEEIVALGVRPELADLYRVHAAKRGGVSYIHDLGLVMLAEQILPGWGMWPYFYKPVRIVEVPYGAPLAHQPERRGTIVISPASRSNRYVVIDQDRKHYLDRAAKLFQS